MTRTSPIAAALRVLGRKGRSTSAHDSTSVQILAQLVKEGKITVGESKFSQGSMLELKVPRNVSPQRIYWEADTFSYSYPLGKVNLKYYLTEKDKNERLKKAKEENDESAKEKLASIVVGASAVELVFKLVSELGVIVRDPLGWVVDIFNKPNLDKKIKDLEKEMGKMSGDMKMEMGKFTEMFDDLKKLSNDMATLKNHLGVKSKIEKGNEKDENKGANESVQAEKKKEEKDEAAKDDGGDGIEVNDEESE